MDRRTLIAIVLIMIVYVLSNQFIWKKKNPPVKPGSQTVQTQSTTTQTPAVPATTDSTMAAPAAIASMEVKSDIPVDNNIILENDSLKIVFSNVGAVVHEVWLKRYKGPDRKTDAQLIPDKGYLLDTQLASGQGLFETRNLVFQHEAITENGFPGIRFVWSRNNTPILEKRFVLERNDALTLSILVQNDPGVTGYSLGYGSGIQDTEHNEKTAKYYKMKRQDFKFVTQIDNTPQAILLAKLKDTKTLSGKINWAGIRSKYFLMAILPDKTVLTSKVTTFKQNDSPAFRLDVKTQTGYATSGDHYRLYFGPNQPKQLMKFQTGLENAADRGASWLRWLYSFFNAILSWLFKLIPNYGVVILIFSLLLKIALHPLTHKSMESSIKMQQIQPLVRDVQNKYKSDPRKMQSELSRIYKENGVSPVGGCLPLLLQMPIFIALYNVLRYSLDMRQAYFFGWLSDLSEPDPIYVLPILMGIFMFVQQKMMAPSQAAIDKMDEKQAAMMQSQKMMTYVMPVMMFFIFKSMPAGLVLYWTVFNILSIIQQYYLQKHLNQKVLTNEVN